jgi:hypothetical protein
MGLLLWAAVEEEVLFTAVPVQVDAEERFALF